VSAVLNGIIASLGIGLTYPKNEYFKSGTKAAGKITVTAYDADGNAILEPSGSSDYNTPIFLSIVSSCCNGAFTLGTHLFQSTSPVGSVTALYYNGAALPGGTGGGTEAVGTVYAGTSPGSETVFVPIYAVIPAST
jgi:hypothetical protein